jgi:hypothetical protein
MAGTLETLENYDTIEEAVREAVTYWLEGADNPRPQVLHDESGQVAVTFVPLGTCGDAVLVVYNVSGIAQRYHSLTYHKSPTTGLICKTTVVCDGREEVLWHGTVQQRIEAVNHLNASLVSPETLAKFEKFTSK